MKQYAALAALAVPLPFLTAPVARQDSASARELHTLAVATRTQAGAPAIGVVLVRPDADPLVVVDGVRRLGHEAHVQPTDAWHWGSITKSMTATLVARLVEADEITWDDTIEQLLGDRVPEMHDEYRSATFRHVLSHRAGLQANIPVARFADFSAIPEDPVADRLEWVRIALMQKPRGPMGETFEYSNNGYVVAGAMLEAALGESWEELIRREVFGPLGMEGAGFGGPGENAPRGHHPDGGKLTVVPPDADNPPALGPAGRVHMPLADMARYLAAHAERRADFLGQGSYDVLHTAEFGGPYAMGWMVTGDSGRWHNGSNTMWYAEAAFDLASGRAAAVAVNDGDIARAQPAVGKLLRRLLDPAAPEASASEAGVSESRGD